MQINNRALDLFTGTFSPAQTLKLGGVITLLFYTNNNDFIYLGSTYWFNWISDIFFFVLILINLSHCLRIPYFRFVPNLRMNYTFDRISCYIRCWQCQKTCKKNTTQLKNSISNLKTLKCQCWPQWMNDGSLKNFQL